MAERIVLGAEPTSVSLARRFWSSTLAGLQATLDERIRQGALLRALGAERKLLISARRAEFGLLGAAAGLLAALGCELVSFLLYRYAFDMSWQPHPWLLLLPLIGAPNPHVAREAALDRPLTLFARRLYLSEGFHAGCATVIWNLALFVTLGQHFDAFGGAIAVAGVAAAAGSLLIGHLIDGGRPLHSLALAYGAAILALLAKALAFDTPLAAVGATALGALVTPMAATAMLAPLYAMARASSCTLRFNMATEGGWDLGCSFACLIAAGLLEAGAGFRLPILLGLIAVSAIWRMLRRSATTSGRRDAKEERMMTRSRLACGCIIATVSASVSLSETAW